MAAAKNPVQTNPQGRVVAATSATNRGWAGQTVPAAKAVAPSKVVAPPVTNGVPSSARAIVDNFLTQFGLQDLGTWAWNRYTQLGGGTDALNQISVEMTQQPAFNARFPAYAPLAKAGEAMSPAEMLAYEQSAKQIFHDAGIPAGFYSTPEELATFMVNNVSASELQSRVQLASQAATTAPDVQQQLSTLYGLPNAQGALTAYFLNPDKALPLIQQQFTGAQIGAEATRTGVGQLTTAEATHLAQIGVTDAQAAQGFGQLGKEQGLFQVQSTGEQAIGLDTQLAAQFDNSAAANLRILRKQQARVADFQGNAGENLQSGGVGGLGASDKSV